MSKGLYDPALLGFVVFCIGGFARMYMVVRINGWSGYLSSQRNLITNYRKLISQQAAPIWPLVVSVTCMPLGLAIVFAVILLSK